MSRSFFVLILLVALPLLAADATPAKKPQATPEQLKAAQAILTEFRKVKTTVDRMPFIEEAGLVHPQAVRLLVGVIEKELYRELMQYRQQYMKIAAGLAGDKANPATLNEVGMLRAKLVEVKGRAELTKEMIDKESDPALARLKALLLTDRSAVFQKSPELSRRREALLVVGQQWEACQALLKEESDDPPPSFDMYLKKEEEIATVLASPMDPTTRQILATNAQIAEQLDPEEARCILDLNMTRILIGLAPLAIDAGLVGASRDHSQDMEKLNFFSHESPVAGKRSFVDRAARFNVSASGENIFLGAVEGAAANLGWWHSPGHHKNMLGDHKRVGVGRSGRHWTEMLGG